MLDSLIFYQSSKNVFFTWADVWRSLAKSVPISSVACSSRRSGSSLDETTPPINARNIRAARAKTLASVKRAPPDLEPLWILVCEALTFWKKRSLFLGPLVNGVCNWILIGRAWTDDRILLFEKTLAQSVAAWGWKASAERFEKILCTANVDQVEVGIGEKAAMVSLQTFPPWTCFAGRVISLLVVQELVQFPVSLMWSFRNLSRKCLYCH